MSINHYIKKSNTIHCMFRKKHAIIKIYSKTIDTKTCLLYNRHISKY